MLLWLRACRDEGDVLIGFPSLDAVLVRADPALAGGSCPGRIGMAVAGQIHVWTGEDECLPLTAVFHDDSFGYRPRRGVADAATPGTWPKIAACRRLRV